MTLRAKPQDTHYHIIGRNPETIRLELHSHTSCVVGSSNPYRQVHSGLQGARLQTTNLVKTR